MGKLLLRIFPQQRRLLTQSSELIERNDMWAHIEACASVFTACLPTLGPLARSIRLESPFNSLRSFFSLSSQSRSFRSMDDEVKLEAGNSSMSPPSSAGGYSHEAGYGNKGYPPNSIKVKTTFRTDYKS
jgi:hypothetical protein